MGASESVVASYMLTVCNSLPLAAATAIVARVCLVVRRLSVGVIAFVPTAAAALCECV